MYSHTISPAEQATWHITTPDGADRHFRHEIFQQFPVRFQKALAKHYLAIFNAVSKGEANLFLLDVKEKLTGQAIHLASSNDDLRLFAKHRSEDCLRFNARQSCPEDGYLVLSQVVTSCCLTQPVPDKTITVEYRKH